MYRSYRISDPKLTTNKVPVSPEDLQIIADNQWGAWSQQLASDEYNAAQTATGLYLSWAVVYAPLELTYSVVKVERTDDFKMPFLVDFDLNRFLTEQRMLAEVGLFVSYFVVTFRSDEPGNPDEYVVIGCTDKRSLQSHAMNESRSTPSSMSDRFGDSTLGMTAREANMTYAIRAERRREEGRRREEEKKRFVSRQLYLLDDDPEYCFAICRFSTADYFADEKPKVIEPSAVYPPMRHKAPRFEVKKAELNKLPRLNAWYTYFRFMGVYYYLWALILVLPCLPLAMLTIPIVAVGGAAVLMRSGLPWRGTQIGYLKAKHAVLPRKVWQIEE